MALTAEQIKELDVASERKIAGTPQAKDKTNLDFAADEHGYVYTPKQAAPVTPTITPTPTTPTPIAPTFKDIYTGLAPDISEADKYAAELAAGYKTAGAADIDPEAIRRKTEQQFQSEIDALNRVYAEKKRQAEVAGAGRLGEGTAIQARRGLIGSSFGAAQTAGVRDINLQIQDAMEAERLAKESSILRDVTNYAAADLAAATKAKQEGGATYLAFLRGEEGRKTQRVSTTIQNILSNEVEPTDEMYAQVAEQLGVREEVLRAFNQN